MTTQNFIDMYGLLLGENAGPVKKMMMVHAAYWALKSTYDLKHVMNRLSENGFTDAEIETAFDIIIKENKEKNKEKLFDLE